LRYGLIADVYERIGATTKRLEMTDHLVDLFRQTPGGLIGKVVYLTQGKFYPDFVGIEIGVADKLAIRAIGLATGHPTDRIEEDYKKTKDMGKTVERFLEKKTQVALFRKPLTVEDVYESLERMAKTTGGGSIDQKLHLLSGLLADATPREAKYPVRTVMGNLRLGIGDMSVLDALAIAYTGDKANRPILERA